MNPDCSIPQETLDAWKKFKFNKADCTNAIIFKIDKNAMTIVVENVYDNCTFEQVQEELEESAPRFLVVSYRYLLNDGRKQFPLVFYYYSPEGSPTQLNMLYSRAKTNFVKTLQAQRSLELRDKEEFTEANIVTALQKA